VLFGFHHFDFPPSLALTRNFLLCNRSLSLFPGGLVLFPRLASPAPGSPAPQQRCCRAGLGAGDRGLVAGSPVAGPVRYCCTCCPHSTPRIPGAMLSRQRRCLPVRLLVPAITLNNRTGRKQRLCSVICADTHARGKAAIPAALAPATAGRTFVVEVLGRLSGAMQLVRREPVACV